MDPHIRYYLRSFDEVWTSLGNGRKAGMAKRALLLNPECADCAIRYLEVSRAPVLLRGVVWGEPRVREKLFEVRWRNTLLLPDKIAGRRAEVALRAWVDFNPDNRLPGYLLIKQFLDQKRYGEASNFLRKTIRRSSRLILPHCRLPDGEDTIFFVPCKDVPKVLWNQPIPMSLLKYWYVSEWDGYVACIYGHLRALGRALLENAPHLGLTTDELVQTSISLAVATMHAEPHSLLHILVGDAILDGVLQDQRLATWWSSHKDMLEELSSVRKAIIKEVSAEAFHLQKRYPDNDLVELVRVMKVSDYVEEEREAATRILQTHAVEMGNYTPSAN